jgi:hypothetical protein
MNEMAREIIKRPILCPMRPTGFHAERIPVGWYVPLGTLFFEPVSGKL